MFKFSFIDIFVLCFFWEKKCSVTTTSGRIELYSPIYLSSYTLGYYDVDKMSSRYAALDSFRGCIEQLTFNGECLPLHDDAERERSSVCGVQPVQSAIAAEAESGGEADVDENEPSMWRFSGRVNSGEIEFVPGLASARHAELRFAFNTSRGNDGTIMCTRDDALSFKAELMGQQLLFSISEMRTRRVLKTLSCRLASNRGGGGGAEWHKIQLVKKSRGQVTVTCNDLTSTLVYDAGDIPFVNTRYGLKIGVDCVNEKGRKYAGDIANVSST